MKMIDDIEAGLADGVEVHDVAVVWNEVVHFASEDAEGHLLEVTACIQPGSLICREVRLPLRDADMCSGL